MVVIGRTEHLLGSCTYSTYGNDDDSDNITGDPCDGG